MSLDQDLYTVLARVRDRYGNMAGGCHALYVYNWLAGPAFVFLSRDDCFPFCDYKISAPSMSWFGPVGVRHCGYVTSSGSVEFDRFYIELGQMTKLWSGLMEYFYRDLEMTTGQEVYYQAWKQRQALDFTLLDYQCYFRDYMYAICG